MSPSPHSMRCSSTSAKPRRVLNEIRGRGGLGRGKAHSECEAAVSENLSLSYLFCNLSLSGDFRLSPLPGVSSTTRIPRTLNYLRFPPGERRGDGPGRIGHEERSRARSEQCDPRYSSSGCWLTCFLLHIKVFCWMRIDSTKQATLQKNKI